MGQGPNGPGSNGPGPKWARAQMGPGLNGLRLKRAQIMKPLRGVFLWKVLPRQPNRHDHVFDVINAIHVIYCNQCNVT